jgi:hypothetical protein
MSGALTIRTVSFTDRPLEPTNSTLWANVMVAYKALRQLLANRLLDQLTAEELDEFIDFHGIDTSGYVNKSKAIKENLSNPRILNAVMTLVQVPNTPPVLAPKAQNTKPKVRTTPPALAKLRRKELQKGQAAAKDLQEKATPKPVEKARKPVYKVGTLVNVKLDGTMWEGKIANVTKANVTIHFDKDNSKMVFKKNQYHLLSRKV